MSLIRAESDQISPKISEYFKKYFALMCVSLTLEISLKDQPPSLIFFSEILLFI